MAIDIHYYARNVEIANNIIFNSNWGIEVSRGEKGGEDYPRAPENVVIRNNFISDLFIEGDDSNKGNGAGIVVREASGVQVVNNTFRNAAGICLVVTWASDALPPTGVTLRNNVSSGCGVAELFLKDTTPPGLALDYNSYDRPAGARLRLGSTAYGLPEWSAVTGFDTHSLAVVSALMPDGKLEGGSPLIDRGVNVGLPFCGSAPDIGAFEYGCP
jgi:hypothetical protein